MIAKYQNKYIYKATWGSKVILEDPGNLNLKFIDSAKMVVKYH